MDNPFLILDIDEQADDEAVHSAYLRQVKAHPPETDPDAFRVIRQAYDTLRTHRQRVAWLLLNPHPPTVAEVVERYLGAGEARRPDLVQLKRLLAGGG